MLSRESGRQDFLTPEATGHERALFKCRMAENAERFEDMVEYIKEACYSTNMPLSPSERNYLSVAYKNSVGTRRAALRCLAAMKGKFESRQASTNVELIDEYYKRVLKELEDICLEVLGLIKNTVMRPEVMANLKDDRAGREFKVFFHKMNADYYRYLAEFAPPDSETQQTAIQNASDHYIKATEAAGNGPDEVILPPSHPIRLGLSLNYSVFLYEIQNRPDEAKKLAKQAFESALDNLDNTGELEYQDSTLILQLLRDNATLWNAQQNEL